MTRGGATTMGRFSRWLPLLAAVAVGACAGSGSGAQASRQGPGHPITVGLAYIPNIQFAPFYVADSLGYYRSAGLAVTLRHHSFAEDEFGAIAAGREDAIFAGGDEMLQARDHAVQLVDVATIYRRYPVAVMVPADSAIRSVSDVSGHSLGVPGPFGETYFGLLAALQGAGVDRSRVNVQNIQFTQVAALLGHRVDAVMGYVNNEAVQFRDAGFAVRVFALSDVVAGLPLVSNGLGVPASVLSARPADIRALVAATLRGVQYTIAHPRQALDISKRYVPGLEVAKNASTALAVLTASLPLWQAPGTRDGYNPPATWQAMALFMAAHGLVSAPIDANAAYSNSYLP
jgi:NitT/TauT family transport system substrate-binding protein